MAARSSPRGCKVLAVFSLLVGIGGLITGFRGDGGALIVGITHLLAAYGLWTGVFWGWYAGLVAYGVGGIRGLWELQASLLAGTLSILFAVVVVGYIYSKRPRFLGDADPFFTEESISSLIK